MWCKSNLYIDMHKNQQIGAAQLGDYLNFVRKNKKVHDFSLKLGVTHWGITFFVIKKF